MFVLKMIGITWAIQICYSLTIYYIPVLKMTIYESKVQMLKIAEDFSFGKFSKYVEFNPPRNNEQTYFPLCLFK